LRHAFIGCIFSRIAWLTTSAFSRITSARTAARVLQGVVRYANTHTDWSLTMLRMWAFAGIPALDEISVDGIITSIYPDELRRRVERDGVPVVQVSSALSGAGLPSVLTDSVRHRRCGGEVFHRFAGFDTSPSAAGRA